MFVNVTNYPLKEWSKEQFDAASKYGEIHHIPFPSIAGDATNEEIDKLAEVYLEKILKLNPTAVCVAGEWTFSFKLAVELLKRNILVLTPCSKRVAEEKRGADGINVKISTYKFLYYRRIQLLED